MRRNGKYSSRLEIRIPPPMKRELLRESIRSGVLVAEIVRRAIEKYFEQRKK